MSKPTVTFGAQCCLCGLDSDTEGVDPLELSVTTAQGDWQMWWAHAACFKDRLTDPPDAPGLFEAEHF